MLRITIICFLLVQFLENPAQKLSKKEKEIISLVHKNNDAAMALLEEAVNINSGTMNLEGVKKVGTIDIKSITPHQLRMYFNGLSEIQILSKYSIVNKIVKPHSM